MRNIAKATKSHCAARHGLNWLPLLWLWLPLAHATPFDEQLADAARNYVQNNMEPPAPGGERTVDIHLIDGRSLDACATPLTVELPGSAQLSRNTTLKMTCPAAWSIYVPTQIHDRYPVVVAASPISPGTIIDASMIRIDLMDPLVTPGSVFSETDLLLGSRAKRYVQAGRPIRANNVCAVCKGDQVTVIAESDGLAVKTLGVAEEDGALGEAVTIRNNRSGNRFQARVEKVGHVVVRM